MTSPPDVQNVPDVWGLLSEARKAYVELNLASNPTGPDWHKWYEHISTLDAALAVRDRFVLVPKEVVDRVAELEERLMVMCVAQLREAEPTEAQYNAAWKWIESDESVVQQVRKKLSVHEFRQIMKGIVFSMQSRPSPDPPVPAPLASQGVEGEPHHER